VNSCGGNVRPRRKRSKSFYEQLGFQITEDRGTFVVLTCEGHELFLGERPNLSAAITPQANVRVMMSDVNSYWSVRVA
jgi:hypothetical protein